MTRVCFECDRREPDHGAPRCPCGGSLQTIGGATGPDAARVVRLFNTYGHRLTYEPADESWTFTIGEWTGPTCRDLDELETALHAARLGANAYVIGQRDRDWVAEVDRLRAIATANAAEAHEAHGELADVLRELARARSQVLQLEQELRLIQARGVDRA